MTATPDEHVIVEPFDADAFKRGAEAAADSFRLYFLNQDEGPMYDVSPATLEAFARKAVEEAIARPGDPLTARYGLTEAIVPESFERGAFIATTAMRRYFVTPNATTLDGAQSPTPCWTNRDASRTTRASRSPATQLGQGGGGI